VVRARHLPDPFRRWGFGHQLVLNPSLVHNFSILTLAEMQNYLKSTFRSLARPLQKSPFSLSVLGNSEYLPLFLGRPGGSKMPLYTAAYPSLVVPS